VPITRWLPRYKIKKNLFGDIAGGITVGIVHLPQGMAYALLASLPAVTGLYVSFFPVLIYVIFGTSRHISIGTFAVISLMIGAVIDKVRHGGVIPGLSCQETYDMRKIQVAVALSLAVGLIHVIMYIFRLGIITLYLSSHMVSGFTCGAAFHVMTSQIPKLFGLNIPRKSGPLALIYTYIDVFKNLYTTNVATLILSACCIILLVIGKEINLRFKKKLPFPLPWELVVVICSTIASYYGFLNLNYGVTIVGEIPTGIQVTVPQTDDLGTVFVDAIPIAIVVFAIAVSLAQMFAVKHVYETDSNQELLAYGLANIFGAFFSCFPAATSLSRSSIWEETGGKTQITGVVSSAVILVILLWIGPLFQSLPEAALASIIIVNLKRMLMQFNQLPPLWRVSRLDATVWLVTWLAVVLLGVDLGLAVGAGYSLLTVVFRTQIGTGQTVVAVGDTGVFRSTKKFNGDDDDSSVLVFAFPGPIYYANHQRFKNQLALSLGFEPALEIHRRKKRKMKEERLQRLTHVNSAFSGDQPDHNGAAASANITPSTTDSEPHLSPESSDATPAKMNSRGSMFKSPNGDVFINGLDTGDSLKHVIIDMTSCSFVDNDTVKTFSSLYSDLRKLEIAMYLAACTS
uniref:STAS domain-containing protein n=1 Tax=Ciona savignyi TaxID=51511 RepID=H2ZI98_CIOSA